VGSQVLIRVVRTATLQKNHRLALQVKVVSRRLKAGGGLFIGDTNKKSAENKIS
jgi:hypothetical protein